jgi:hypothetical protein
LSWDYIGKKIEARYSELIDENKEEEYMEAGLKEEFLSKWLKYFGQAELPITFYYTDQEDRAEKVKVPSAHQCVIGVLSRVRKGTALCLEEKTVGCGGGKRCLGFPFETDPDFNYFLSTGIPGRVEGERYKKSPELVEQVVKGWAGFKAPARYIVFRRWDLLETGDEPEVVIFFAKPNVLSALFTLANFDESEDRVYTPFGAGCSSIVQNPYLEKEKDSPQCVIGMFDISARPFVEKDVLTFAAPMKKFQTMVANMDESFLITRSWEKVKKRI